MLRKFALLAIIIASMPACHSTEQTNLRNTSLGAEQMNTLFKERPKIKISEPDDPLEININLGTIPSGYIDFTHSIEPILSSCKTVQYSSELIISMPTPAGMEKISEVSQIEVVLEGTSKLVGGNLRIKIADPSYRGKEVTASMEITGVCSVRLGEVQQVQRKRIQKITLP